MARRIVLRHLLLVCVLAAALAFFWLTGIGCPFRALFHIPCPACGTTRALLCLLRGDVAHSLYYHPLAVPLVAAVLAGIHREKIPWLKKRGVTVYLYFTAAAVLVLYLVRFSSIP